MLLKAIKRLCFFMQERGERGGERERERERERGGGERKREREREREREGERERRERVNLLQQQKGTGKDDYYTS